MASGSEAQSMVLYDERGNSDESSRFMFEGDLDVEAYLEQPGFSMEDLTVGQTLLITGENPDEIVNGEQTYFQQKCLLWRGEDDKFWGQMGTISKDGQASGELFWIDSLRGTMTGRGTVAESGPAHAKYGYFLTAMGVHFEDGIVAPNVSLAGKIIDLQIFDGTPLDDLGILG